MRAGPERYPDCIWMAAAKIGPNNSDPTSRPSDVQHWTQANMERATPAATEERLQGGKAEPVSEYASSPLDSPSTPMEGFIHRTSTIDRDSVRHRSQGKYVYDPLSFHQPIIIVPAKVSKRERESGTVIRWIGAKYLTGFWMGAFYDVSNQPLLVDAILLTWKYSSLSSPFLASSPPTTRSTSLRGP